MVMLAGKVIIHLFGVAVWHTLFCIRRKIVPLAEEVYSEMLFVNMGKIILKFRIRLRKQNFKKVVISIRH